MTKTRKKHNTPSANEAYGIGDTPDQARPTAVAKNEPTTASARLTKRPSKAQQLAEFVVRDEGATLDQMIEITGWLPHTTRAALTGLKKKGFKLTSDKIDGVRTYRGVAPE